LFGLAELYESGAGVTRDPVQAYKFFDLAARRGYEYALKRRDQLAITMSEPQIEEAKRLILEWPSP
jgi:TPR repeat protein